MCFYWLIISLSVSQSRIQGISDRVNIAVSLLEAAVVGNIDALGPFFTELIPLLTWALKSPLVAQKICNLFVSLRRSVFDMDDDTFGKLIFNILCCIDCEFSQNPHKGLG